MVKKNLKYILIFISLVFIITIQSLYVVHGKEEYIYDPENDVYRFDKNTFKKGDYHDEIDITNATLIGQYANVSFAANFLGVNISCTIYFFENYNPQNITFEYGLFAQYFSILEDYDVFFIHFTKSETAYSTEFWTGATWSSNVSNALSIGNVTGPLIEGFIPVATWTIPENVTWYVVSTAGNPLEDQFFYTDFAPDEYFPYKRNVFEIPSYNLSIILLIVVGMSLYLCKRLITNLFK